MQPEARLARRTTFAALSVVAILVGTVAGLGDAIVAVLRHRTAGAVPFLVIDTVWLAALLAFFGALPFVAFTSLIRRPRAPSRALGLILAVLAATPFALALARSIHHRIPWDAGDLGLAAGGGAGLALGVAAVAELLARLLGPRGGRLLPRLAQLLPVGVLIVGPALVRVALVSRPPDGGHGAGDGPSLLLLSVDTLRADRLGTGGDPRARTPWIDRLARTAVLRATSVAPSPWTLPSLGTLLTGTYPGEHRLLEDMSGLSDAVPDLAECARADGLRTAAFVSNPWLATRSLARGFDVFDVAERPVLLDPVRGTELSIALSKVILRLAKPDDAARLSRRALSWQRRGEGRYFLWVHYFDPHLPNWPPPPFDRLEGPPPRFTSWSLTVEQIRAGDFPGGDEGRREIATLYAGEVAYTDRAIGALLRGLDALDENSRTAILFTADHGEELWDHGGYGHGHAMFDEVIRVPLVLRPPGGVPGRVVGDLARLVDVAPTSLALAGIDCLPEHPFRGLDLTSAGDTIVSSYGEAVLYGPEQKYLRTERWKLILDAGADADSAASARLYDLVFDPAERLDVFRAVPGEADTLLTVLSEWRRRVGSDAGGVPAISADLDPAIRAQLDALGYLP